MEARESRLFDASRRKSDSDTIYSHPNGIKDLRMAEGKSGGQWGPEAI